MGHDNTPCHGREGDFDTLQHTATHCNMLQHAALNCNTPCHGHDGDLDTLQNTATLCNTLQHTATHCNTLPWTATHLVTDMKAILALRMHRVTA